MQPNRFFSIALVVLFTVPLAFSIYLLWHQFDLARENQKTSAIVSQLDSRLTILVNAALQINTNLGQLRTQVTETTNSLRGDLKTLDTNLAGVNTRTTALTTDTAALKSQSESQNTFLRNLQANFTDIGRQSAALGDRLSSAQSDLSALSTLLANSQTQLSALSTRLDQIKIADFNAIYLDKWPSVFMIQTGRGFGSGWLLEPGFIVTAAHVVAGFSTVTVRQAAAPPFSAVVLARDSQRDIALLRYDTARVSLDSRAKPLSLGQISPNDIARPLLAMGYSGVGVKPDGTVGSAPANFGVLSAILIGNIVVMDVPIDHGDSGGPVFDQNGFVVGMAVSGIEGSNGTFYAVQVDEIRAALPSLKSGVSR